MKRFVASLLAILSLALSTPAWAATKTATLFVPGMVCSACPITLKKALGKIEGVEKVDVTFEKKEIAVTFDDAKTNAKALLEATKKAGYPSTVKP